MFLLLFGFWLLLNGRWTGEIALTGLFVCALVRLLCWKLFDMTLRRELRLMRALPRIALYLLLLVGSVLRAAAQTIRVIWSPRKPEACLVSFSSALKSAWGRTLLANSITLTPGTITVEARGGRFLVHCLDRRFSGGLEGGRIEACLRDCEEGGGGDA